jgi:hypothetical protein
MLTDQQPLGCDVRSNLKHRFLGTAMVQQKNRKSCSQQSETSQCHRPREHLTSVFHGRKSWMIRHGRQMARYSVFKPIRPAEPCLKQSRPGIA